MINVRHLHWTPAEEMSDLVVFKEDDHDAFFKLESELVSGCFIQRTSPPALKSKVFERVFKAGGGYLQRRINAEDRYLLAGV